MERARAKEGRGMRTLALVIAAALLTVSVGTLVAPVEAAAPPTPSYSVTVFEVTLPNATAPAFSPNPVLIPEVPIILNLTFLNNDNTSSTAQYNVTVDNTTGVPVVWTGPLSAGQSATVRLTISSMDNVTYLGTSFRPSLTTSGGIAFYDALHPAATGEIDLAGGGGLPYLHTIVYGNTINGQPRFENPIITLPEVPIILNVTFLNNQTVASLVAHTFTIADSKGAVEIDSGLMAPQQSVSLQFTVNSLTNITYKGVSFVPQAPANGTAAIQFYCIPHQSLGMLGMIVVGSFTPPVVVPQKGVLLRAYWIGMIGIAAMLVWIGISYFVIKSSSPHFKDHSEHLRKGLP